MDLGALFSQAGDKLQELGSAAIGKVTPDTQVDLGNIFGSAPAPAAPAPQTVQTAPMEQPGMPTWQKLGLVAVVVVVALYLLKRL